MSLQLEYSKKIAKAFGKVAVYLPGEDINVGDIVQFPYGIGLFSTAPFGSFQKITDLNNLGINYVIANSISTSSYQFKSENSVDSKFDLGGNIDLGTDKLPRSQGRLKLSFSKKGGLFFYALNCEKHYINDLLSIESEVDSNGKEMLWENTFLITSLTIAKKALAIQSISKNSEVTIKGDIKNTQANKLKLDANAKISFEQQKGDMFIKNWSDDVTVFVDVMRFKKKIFNKKKTATAAPPFHHETRLKINLESVDLSQYLNK